jgi:hypothetical protein
MRSHSGTLWRQIAASARRLSLSRHPKQAHHFDLALLADLLRTRTAEVAGSWRGRVARSDCYLRTPDGWSRRSGHFGRRPGGKRSL